MSLLLTGCGGGADGSRTTRPLPPPSPRPRPRPPRRYPPKEPHPANSRAWGPGTPARIPAGTEQVVPVTGRGANFSVSTLALYERTDDGWQQTASWAAHNALRGWSNHHMAGDLRLTDRCLLAHRRGRTPQGPRHQAVVRPGVEASSHPAPASRASRSPGPSTT
ncbi:hypothetical protein ACRAWF_21650 [Streptomyces sp. L7]